MAQLDILRQQQEQAKRLRDALAQKQAAQSASPTRTSVPRPDPSDPTIWDSGASYLADKLVPQKGQIDTRPRQAGKFNPWGQALYGK